MIALSFIAAMLFVSVFAYVLAPDHTPNSNNMIIELGAKPPGFTRDFILMPKPQRQLRGNAVERCFAGTPSNYTLVPVNGYRFLGDTLVALHYIDEGLEDTLYCNINTFVNDAEFSAKDIAESSDLYPYIKAQFITKRTFYLGTDRYGRDILSRLITGSRVSLSVGFVAVLLSLSIGIFLGSIAGYFGGWVDTGVMWLINILWSVPTLLLVFAITLTIGKGFWEIFVAIGLTMWVGAARLIRGQVMVIRQMEYVTAARALGLGNFRIIARHILPNVAGPIMVIAASNFAAAILTEAGLSFLGIGVQPPQPSWGLMIKEHYNFLLTNRPFAALIPGIAIMLLVYSFNVLANALRDILDVKGQ